MIVVSKFVELRDGAEEEYLKETFYRADIPVAEDVRREQEKSRQVMQLCLFIRSLDRGTG